MPEGKAGYAYIHLGERDELLAIRQIVAEALPSGAELSDPETYHITLSYAEAIDDANLESAYIDRFEPFSVRVSGLSLFNNPEERALVAVVDHSPELDKWQTEVYEALAAVTEDMSQFSNPEAWQPHITVAYLPDGVDMPQIAFEPFTLGVESIRYARDDYKVVREVMANETETTKAPTAIKALNETGRVGGYLVVWGDRNRKDLQGEYFTPETDLGLTLYDRRPMLYHHTLDGTIKADTIGVIDLLQPDDVGVWAEAQLNLHNKYLQAVQKLIKQGVLGWSSGALPITVQKAADGCIKRWWIVEGSATPTPAEPRQTDISVLKAAYKELGLDITPVLEQTSDLSAAESAVEPSQPSADEHAIEPPAREQASDAVQENSSDAPDSQESDMNSQEVVNAVLDAVLQQLGATLSDEQRTQILQSVMAGQQPQSGMDAARSAEVAAQVAPIVTKAVSDLLADQQQQRTAVNGAATSAVKNLFAGMQPAPRTNGATVPDPNTPQGARIQITRANKYSHLKAEDLGFFYDFMSNGARNAPRGMSWSPTNELLRTMADKTIKAVNNNEFEIGHDAIKAVHFLADQSVAIKTGDELDYSTLSSYGDEWVPDLWASTIWDKVRLDNVVARELQMIEMPSNPFELPIESTDPTVYHVSETTDEAQLGLNDSSSAIPDSQIGTGKVQLSAEKLSLRVGWSNELEEDSILAVTPQFRKQAQRAMQDAVDNVCVNGDTDLTQNTNINLIDGTPTTQRWTAQNGLLKQAIITTTANLVSASGAAISLSMMRAARMLLAAQYMTPASMLRWFVDPTTYISMLNIPEILTAAEYGLDATVIKGDVRVIDGIPILPSAELGRANTAGKVSATPGNNIYGRACLARTSQWYLGYRRRPTVTVEYKSFYDAFIMTAHLRLALKAFDNDNVAVIYYAA